MSFAIPSTHPALPGHFPGHPIVPAVVILDLVRQELERRRPGHRISGVSQAKFLRPLSPDEMFDVRFEMRGEGRCRFEVMRAGQPLVRGELILDATGA